MPRALRTRDAPHRVPPRTRAARPRAGRLPQPAPIRLARFSEVAPLARTGKRPMSTAAVTTAWLGEPVGGAAAQARTNAAPNDRTLEKGSRLRSYVILQLSHQVRSGARPTSGESTRGLGYHDGAVERIFAGSSDMSPGRMIGAGPGLYLQGACALVFLVACSNSRIELFPEGRGVRGDGSLSDGGAGLDALEVDAPSDASERDRSAGGADAPSDQVAEAVADDAADTAGRQDA